MDIGGYVELADWVNISKDQGISHASQSAKIGHMV